MITKKRFSNEKLTKTVEVDSELFTEFSLATIQSDFSLSAVDYMRLKNDRTSVTGWALNIGLAVFGYGLSLVPKYISSFFGEPAVIAKGELVTLAVGALVVVVLLVFGLFLPSEKKKLMKEIKEHFNNTPKIRRRV